MLSLILHVFPVHLCDLCGCPPLVCLSVCLCCRDGDKLAPSVQKKFDELEVNLLHLQQNIDIPEVQLVVNPEVQQAVKKAQASGRKPDVADFGSKVADSNFLNALQKDVNKWKTDIKKVLYAWGPAKAGRNGYI